MWSSTYSVMPYGYFYINWFCMKTTILILPNSAGNSSCLCFIQVTTWCCNSFAHSTGDQSHRVGCWTSSWTSGYSLAFLFFIIHKTMDTQSSGSDCMCFAYHSIPHTGCSSARSYSSWAVGNLVPFSERHTEYVREKFLYQFSFF